MIKFFSKSVSDCIKPPTCKTLYCARSVWFGCYTWADIARSPKKGKTTQLRRFCTQPKSFPRILRPHSGELARPTKSPACVFQIHTSHESDLFTCRLKLFPYIRFDSIFISIQPLIITSPSRKVYKHHPHATLRVLWHLNLNSNRSVVVLGRETAHCQWMNTKWELISRASALSDFPATIGGREWNSEWEKLPTQLTIRRKSASLTHTRGTLCALLTSG